VLLLMVNARFSQVVMRASIACPLPTRLCRLRAIIVALIIGQIDLIAAS